MAGRRPTYTVHIVLLCFWFYPLCHTQKRKQNFRNWLFNRPQVIKLWGVPTVVGLNERPILSHRIIANLAGMFLVRHRWDGYEMCMSYN